MMHPDLLLGAILAALLIATTALGCAVMALAAGRRVRFVVRQAAAWRLVRFAAPRGLPEAQEFHRRWLKAGEPEDVERLVEEISRDELSPPFPPNVTPIAMHPKGGDA